MSDLVIRKFRITESDGKTPDNIISEDRFRIQEMALKSVFLGENRPLFKKLLNSNWLAFTRQLENVMKRVTLGEPKNYSALSALHRLTQNPGGSVPRGFAVLTFIRGLCGVRSPLPDSPFPTVPPGHRGKTRGLRSNPKTIFHEFSNSPFNMPSWLTPGFHSNPDFHFHNRSWCR